MSPSSTVHGSQHDTKYYKIKNVSVEIEDFVETHLCKLRGILRSHYGFYVTASRMLVLIEREQNLTAVELSECTTLWLWICMRPYLLLVGRNNINSSMPWYPLSPLLLRRRYSSRKE